MKKTKELLTEHIQERAGQKTLVQKLRSAIGANWKALVAVIIILTMGAVATYFFVQYKKTSRRVTELQGSKATQTEIKALVAKVSALVLLPEGEDPTIATVTDPDKLADQPFFANALSGDKVLIYTNSQRAVLYRPSTNKVIEIAPLNFNGDQSNDSSSPTSSAAVDNKALQKTR